mmetsp:Transcript_92466/g.287724  ORF Transcript_92466/g.287724 Transcript_92466/m.287724 type:complete len:252 (-) Transcript_92466:285-1040(-)
MVAGVLEAALQVLDGHDVLVVDVAHEVHELPALLHVVVRAVLQLARRGGHEEAQALLRLARGLAGEGHERVDGVRVDREAHVGEDLEEERGRGLHRADAREGVEVVGVAGAAAVGEGCRDEAHVLAPALVRLVIVHAGELGQLRVHGVDVVEVHKVLGDELPVALDAVVLHADELRVVEVVARELPRQVPKHLAEGGRGGLLVQEDDASEDLQPWHAHEAELLLALLGRGGRRRGLQGAVQAVGPPVVGAN